MVEISMNIRGICYVRVGFYDIWISKVVINKCVFIFNLLRVFFLVIVLFFFYVVF